MVDSETYDICPSCGGMWLDRDEFHRATREAEVYGRIGKEISKQEYLLAPANDNCGYIPCVRCGKLMNRKNFARISGVIIDECSVHGVWLDAGELNKMQHFIADGGLERSQDREIEKTKNELRELAIQVDQTAFSNKLIHFWNFKRWLFGG
jgi:Zn-finger nucleic acid-binding protein